jgi:hypothetical protein
MALVKPTATANPPAPGTLAYEYLDGYSGDARHCIWLPANYTPEQQWPVIVEFLGNMGEVDGERSCLGWGMSNGGQGFIYVIIPYVNPDKSTKSGMWFTFESKEIISTETISYFKQLIAHLVTTYNADPKRIVTCGFSRGSTHPNVIGYDDDIAALVQGMVTYSGFDDGTYNPTDMNFDRWERLRDHQVFNSIGTDDIDSFKGFQQRGDWIMQWKHITYTRLDPVGIAHHPWCFLSESGEQWYSYITAVRNWMNGVLATPTITNASITTAQALDTFIINGNNLKTKLTVKIDGIRCFWIDRTTTDATLQIPEGVSAGAHNLTIEHGGTVIYTKPITITAREISAPIVSFDPTNVVFAVLPAIEEKNYEGTSRNIVVYQGPARKFDVNVGRLHYSRVKDGPYYVEYGAGYTSLLLSNFKNIFSEYSELTVVMWVKWMTTPWTQTLMGGFTQPADHLANNTYYIHPCFQLYNVTESRLLYANRTAARTGEVEPMGGTKTLPPSATVYAMVSFVKSQNTIKMYLNNELAGSEPYNHGTIDFNRPLAFMGSEQRNNNVKGAFAGAIVYNAALTDQEITDLHTNSFTLGGKLALRTTGELVPNGVPMLNTYVIVEADKSLCGTFDQYPYKYDLSKIVSGGWWGKIATAANICVVDLSTNLICPSDVSYLDLVNRKGEINWSAPMGTVSNPRFAFCVGPDINVTSNTAAYTSAAITNRWGFNEASGNSIDSCGSRNGVLTDVEREGGIFGKTTKFSNGKITHDHEILGSGDRTIFILCKISNQGPDGYGRIFDNGKTLAYTGLDGVHKLMFSSDGGTTLNKPAIFVEELQTWRRLAFVRKSDGKSSIYIDGVLLGTDDTPSGAPAAGTTNLIIGNRNSGDRRFAGSIDDFSITSDIKSAQYIATDAAMLLNPAFWTLLDDLEIQASPELNITMDMSNQSELELNAYPELDITMDLGQRDLDFNASPEIQINPDIPGTISTLNIDADLAISIDTSLFQAPSISLNNSPTLDIHVSMVGPDKVFVLRESPLLDLDILLEGDYQNLVPYNPYRSRNPSMSMQLISPSTKVRTITFSRGRYSVMRGNNKVEFKAAELDFGAEGGVLVVHPISNDPYVYYNMSLIPGVPKGNVVFDEVMEWGTTVDVSKVKLFETI